MRDPIETGQVQISTLWAGVCEGDTLAFADWMGRVERPIRRSLEPFARAVDAEGIVQETMLRMWLFAQDGGEEFAGENGSLFYAIVMARNIARNEARKHCREFPAIDAAPPDADPRPAPPPDPFLGKLIRNCIEKLTAQPREALLARLKGGHAFPDKSIAEGVKMTLNTFLQNFTRARKQLQECLENNGVSLKEILR